MVVVLLPAMPFTLPLTAYVAHRYKIGKKYEFGLLSRAEYMVNYWSKRLRFMTTYLSKMLSLGIRIHFISHRLLIVREKLLMKAK